MTEVHHAGIDISAKTLEVCADLPGRSSRTFANTEGGHRELATWLTKGGVSCRVVIEPTGIYSLDLALALHDAPGIEVMIANPRRISSFAKATAQRGKTDAMDAEVLLLFCQTMPFTPWARPTNEALELRQITRHADRLVVEQTRVSNQLHAAEATSVTPTVVLDDLRAELESIGVRVRTLRKAALAMVKASPKLLEMLTLLTSVPGIAEVSALVLIAELSLLPEDMTARQWVAHAGLDPKPKESGTSVRGQTRISHQGNRYLRRVLFMPAMTASVRSPHVSAYCAKLRTRGKTRLEAIVAAMRKLLHAIHGILRTASPWDGSKFFAEVA